MSPRPFVNRETGTLDTDQLLVEAVPLAKLVGSVAVLALVPYGLAFALGGRSLLGVLLAVVGQFVLAVGTGLVLIYVIARGIALGDG